MTQPSKTNFFTVLPVLQLLWDSGYFIHWNTTNDSLTAQKPNNKTVITLQGIDDNTIKNIRGLIGVKIEGEKS